MRAGRNRVSDGDVLMTTVTLMSNTTVLGDEPYDGITPVAVPGNPTLATYTLSIMGPPNEYAGATVLASVDGQNFLPLVTLAIEADGPNTVTVQNQEPGNYVMYDAQLNYISPGGNAANLTMTY